MQGKRLILVMCLGQIGNLLPHVVVPAVMVSHLIPAWGLSNAQAGLMAAAYAGGYMLAVPVLTALTDRHDARRILLLGSLFSALATLAFGALAQGLASAMLLWGLAGMGFAGAYMPGLRALTDRLDAHDSSRSVTLYTASFSLGVGLSFLVAQWAADGFGWRWAFYLTGLGPLAMVGVAWALKPVPPPAPKGHLLDFRPVLKNRPTLGYILGYGAHCFELYGMRTWIVAFWTFVMAHHPGAALPSPMAVSVVVTLLAMPASIWGNELSIRHGRHRAITWIQIASAGVALSIGLLAGSAPWAMLLLVLAYAVTVPADSGSLTAGMSASADPQFKGVTLALHSTVGFGLSALAGWLVGATLDAFGGAGQPLAWTAAFGVLAAGVLCGPLALRWSAQGRGAAVGR
jgi:predicted MFS family arabinose efflux permease